MFENDITKIRVAGKIYSAIRIGREANEVPKHLLQAERKEGMVIYKDQISSFAWRGITKDAEYQYAYFDECNIESIYTLTTTNRDNALNLIEEIAYGLLNAKEEFLSLESGVFPLYRIYILDKERILLLPPDMGDLIAIARMGERRRNEVNNLTKRGTEPSYELILEMGELLYFAATGILPYAKSAIRTSGASHIPLSWYEAGLNEEAYSLIDKILNAKERVQRDIGGNRASNKSLIWFLQNASKAEWNLKSRSEEEADSAVTKTENKKEYISYFTKATKRARTIDFWRVKGALIVTAAALIIILSIVFGNILKESLKPPVTKDMNQQELIMAIYDMQSSLDANHINDPVRGKNLPQYTEVTNLFVNKQTRMAYEQLDPLVKAADWINAGKPEIMETAYIYGVVLNSIEQLDSTRWQAVGTWYTPYPYEKDEDDYIPPEGYTAVYSYEVVQNFTIEWNRRGWWQITNSAIPSYRSLGMELVKTYEKAPINLIM